MYASYIITIYLFTKILNNFNIQFKIFKTFFSINFYTCLVTIITSIPERIFFQIKSKKNLMPM